jgi:hypothetical protein
MSETILIDRVPLVQQFSDMLESKTNKRMLRIIGLENMGKSRLLREFKLLTDVKSNARCALVDLRSRYQGYSDIIFQVTQQIPTIEYKEFFETQQKLSTSHQIDIKELRLLLSPVTINVQEQKNDDYDRQLLTSAFCKDLRLAKFDFPVVLLFDTFDGASEKIQDWLIEQLVTALLQISNIFVVVAGRSLPEPPNTWRDNCLSFELLPVSLDDTVSYCDKLGIDVSIDIIKAFHDAFDGSPGLFSTYAPKLNKEK